MRTAFFFLLLFPLHGFSQSEHPPYTLKIAPIELVNPFRGSVNVHADLPLSMRFGLDLGVGWAYDSGAFARHKGETYSGIKFNPALKYFFKHARKRSNYVSLIVKYSNIQNLRYINIVRQGNQYVETVLNKRHFVNYGVALRLGKQTYLGKQKRVVLETFWGIGWRQSVVSNGPLPPDAAFPSEADLVPRAFSFNFDRLPGIYTTPDIILGLYLGWRLGRAE